MELLQQSGMRDMLDDLVLREKVPVIGICVGMQILARTSEEGKLPGLGWIDADVKAFKSRDATKDMALAAHGLERRSPGVAQQAIRGA